MEGRHLPYDRDRAAEFVLALMYLDIHEEVRAWKGYPWDVLNALHEQGLTTDPKRKAKSVVLTEEGLARAQKAFNSLLAMPATAAQQSRPSAPTPVNRLPQLQTALVERLLRPICEPHSDPSVATQLRHGYRIDGYSVVLFESRPAYRAPYDWQDHDVAKFRFVNTKGIWELFCQFRDLKWRSYEPLPESPDLDVLVAEVRNDPTGIFCG
jgi:hypothetical protein